MVLAGAHNTPLVVLSIIIAIFASFTALDIAGRIRASAGSARRIWISAAALALGGGVWSMHFVAMLAFSMPGMLIDYDLGLTVFSLALAVGFTGAGFTIMSWRGPLLHRALPAGLLMGLGVLAMHYVGMAAMRMPATLRYSHGWFAISVFIAIGAATAAVWLASRDRKLSHRLVAACVMGAAIAGMHYAGMRAAVFTAHAGVTQHGGIASLGQAYLASAIAATTVVILLLALGAARLERLLTSIARREARIALRLKVADLLRAGGSQAAMQEIAGLMGAHFGVSRTGYGQLDPVEDIFTYDICWTDGSAKPLLGRFPAAAFGPRIVAALKAGRTVAVEDLLQAEISREEETQNTARAVDTRSILVVPFVREGRLQTIVYLNDRAPRRWHADDIAFMEELAERTRLVIERDAVEAKLRDLNATLEARVAARTEELRQTQDALLQSQKMEAVGQLVSGLAHDFNNVLGAVVGALDLIGRRAEDAPRVRTLAQAGLEAAERGAKLTSQLLAFSRTRSIQLEPLLVCDVIEDMRDMLARTLGPMVRLELRLNPQPVPVLADATQIEMMVLNLAINARDAMPDGGDLSIRTAVRTIQGRPDLADGDYVEIAVSDTGVGMDEATLARALEPFFTTKPVGKGTGLGLAQIYGSVRQIGGAVAIESVLGQGATVRLLLPCTDRQPVRSERAPDEHETPFKPPLKLLVVDDDYHHRTVLVSALEALGHQVLQAPDGPSALAALEDDLPEAVVLDFAMPGMNGAEVGKTIRQRWPSLPILFTSGYADTDAIQAAVGDDAVILRKPFRIRDLLRALKGLDGLQA